MKEISKDEIPDWDYGDVVIKTFSFGEQSAIANLVAKIQKKNDNTFDVEYKEEVGLDTLNIITLASGIYSIKGKDNIGFVLKPGLHRNDKMGFVDNNISFKAGEFLLKKINDLNNYLSDDKKKG